MSLQRQKLVYTIKVVAETWKQGIGMSKREVQQSNQGYSPYVHSYSTFNRYMGIVKEFVSDMKNQGKKRVEDIKYEDVKQWLEAKAFKFTEKTLKINMSALNKYFDTVNRQDISQALRKDYSAIYSKARASSEVLAFSNPERVVNSMRGEQFQAIAKLQLYTGARLGDVKKISVDVAKNQVIIEKSKGGKTRTVSIDANKMNEVVKAHEIIKNLSPQEWKQLRQEYPAEVHRICVKLGERYTGTHAFRASWAIREYQRLIGEGKTEAEALKIVSQELGHERISMSVYYLKK